MAFEITIPRLGWSMDEGIFAGWLKKDGDAIRLGEAMFELEGEKAIQEIEAVDSGILAIAPNGPQPGDVLKVGAIVGYLLINNERPPWIVDPTAQPEHRSASAPPPVEQEKSGHAAASGAVDLPPASPSVRRLARQPGVSLQTVVATGSGGRLTEADVQAASVRDSDRSGKHVRCSATALVATPRARRAAARLGMDWTLLQGTGRNGRIRERDVAAAAATATETSGSVPATGSAKASSRSQRLPLSGRRRTIADRLSTSQRQTVAVTITSRADATNLISLRRQFKSAGQVPVPAIHDVVAKLVADTLRQHLLLAGRREEDAIILPDPDELHIGIAVDTPDGLLVPVLRNVSTEKLAAICHQSTQLIEKARQGRLSAAEMEGGVFTITNLGSFGIDAFTPVINFPESAILGLGAIRNEPVFTAEGQVSSRELITLSLTFDHQIIDGAPAARFLKSLVTAIENPAARLLAAH